MDTRPDIPAQPLQAPPPTQDIFVARQSLYDAQLRVAGYEVLFRGNHENPVVADGNQATSELLLSAVVDIVSDGYALAIDDAVFRDELKPLLRLASIVKIELPSIPTADLPFHVQQFRRYPVKLLAEKVETLDEFTRCRDLGFDYFQGFVLSRPQMIPGKRGQPSGIAVLPVLSRLSDPDVRIDELEQIIAPTRYSFLEIARECFDCS